MQVQFLILDHFIWAKKSVKIIQLYQVPVV